MVVRRASVLPFKHAEPRSFGILLLGDQLFEFCIGFLIGVIDIDFIIFIVFRCPAQFYDVCFHLSFSFANSLPNCVIYVYDDPALSPFLTFSRKAEPILIAGFVHIDFFPRGQ